MPEAKIRDMFMNFKALDLTMGATGVLAETSWPTGLSIRGGLAMLVHLVEWSFSFPQMIEVDGKAMLDYAMSTRSGLAAMPYIGDDGYVDGGMAMFDVRITTSGMSSQIDRDGLCRHSFLPPVPIAAAELNFYTYPTLGGGFTAWAISVRVGFTTVELDSKLYTEIAEVWGW